VVESDQLEIASQLVTIEATDEMLLRRHSEGGSQGGEQAPDSWSADRESVSVVRCRAYRCALSVLPNPLTVQLVIEAPKRRSTDQFERYALQLAQIATTHTVANHLNVSWNAILEMIV
jgi:hypothetical protein